jgi:hypothetical protein
MSSTDPDPEELGWEGVAFSPRPGSAVWAATVGECIHPRRARPLAHSLRLIWCGISARYPALESRFNERIDSRLAPCELVGVPPSVYRER